jgi:hypothetical protein
MTDPDETVSAADGERPARMQRTEALLTGPGVSVDIHALSEITASAAVSGVDWAALNRQRAALLSALDHVAPVTADALEGVLSLVDSLCNDAENDGVFTATDRKRWWREGCITHGLGDPYPPLTGSECEDGTVITAATTPYDQFLVDVFTTALEGGIGYWSHCTAYHWLADDTADCAADHTGFYADIVKLYVSDDSDDSGSGASHRIDRKVIAKGYTLASTTWRDRYRWSSGKPPLVVTDGTDWDFDAGDADAIVQLGLFGDVAYR